MEDARECVGDFGCAARGEEDMVVQNGKVDNLVLLNAQNLFWSSEDAATLPTHYGEAAAGVWAIFHKKIQNDHLILHTDMRRASRDLSGKYLLACLLA